MRTRDEIEKDIQPLFTATLQDRLGFLTLETLLDIRDLLMEDTTSQGDN